MLPLFTPIPLHHLLPFVAIKFFVKCTQMQFSPQLCIHSLSVWLHVAAIGTANCRRFSSSHYHIDFNKQYTVSGPLCSFPFAELQNGNYAKLSFYMEMNSRQQNLTEGTLVSVAGIFWRCELLRVQNIK